MIDLITSDKNDFIKRVLKLKTKKERDKSNLFYVEGERFVSEIPPSIKIHKYIISSEFQKKDFYTYDDTACLIVSENVFKKISDTMNPQGIIAICEKPRYSLNIDAEVNNFFVVLDRISDPGNLGTIIRTAEALGSNGIFLSSHCVDVYNPKVLRSTMGSVFHTPIYTDLDLTELLEKFTKRNIKIISTHLNGDKSPSEVNLSSSVAILIGNEANGILDEYVNKSDFLVKIPMLGKVNSLNASMSSAILFYEVMRQRNLSNYI